MSQKIISGKVYYEDQIIKLRMTIPEAHCGGLFKKRVPPDGLQIERSAPAIRWAADRSRILTQIPPDITGSFDAQCMS